MVKSVRTVKRDFPRIVQIPENENYGNVEFIVDTRLSEEIEVIIDLFENPSEIWIYGSFDNENYEVLDVFSIYGRKKLVFKTKFRYLKFRIVRENIPIKFICVFLK